MDITGLIKEIVFHIVWFVLFFIIATILGFLILSMAIWDCVKFIINTKSSKKNIRGLSWIEKNCMKIFKI